ncbi:hypothetical protein D3C80_1551290 [compost metagenome]
MVTPRSRIGKAIQALISDNRITPAAMKISRSRSGKALPAPISSGTDITPAKVTAPRTPPRVSNQQERAVGISTNAGLPRQRRTTPMARQMLCTQMNRSRINAAKIASTSRQRQARVGHTVGSWLTTALMMSGNCKPSSRKIKPLKANSSNDHTLRLSRRVLVWRGSRSSQLCIMPAATAERMPDTPRRSAST